MASVVYLATDDHVERRRGVNGQDDFIDGQRQVPIVLRVRQTGSQIESDRNSRWPAPGSDHSASQPDSQSDGNI